MHHTYLLALSALFLLVFAVMLHSLVAHRRQHASLDATARRFYGPTGSVQWLWASVPLAILAIVGFTLLQSAEASNESNTAADKAVGSMKTALASSHDESDRPYRIRHSGLDPESSGAPLDSGFRRNDAVIHLFHETHQ